MDRAAPTGLGGGDNLKRSFEALSCPLGSIIIRESRETSEACKSGPSAQATEVVKRT